MIPPDIAATMREALRWMRDDDLHLRLTFGKDERRRIIKRIDAALHYLDTLPAAPAPDWSKAPDWAQWWAVDADGAPYWFECKPISGDAKWVQIHQQWARDKRLYVDLPIGIDWRETLTARPQEDK